MPVSVVFRDKFYCRRRGKLQQCQEIKFPNLLCWLALVGRTANKTNWALVKSTSYIQNALVV